MNLVATSEFVAANRQGIPLWPVWLFAASMVVPAGLSFEIGGLMITPQRAILIVVAATIARRLSASGHLALPDLLVIAASFWAVLASFVHLGPGSAIERGGAFALEVAVAYLLPVAILRSVADVRALARGFFLVIAALAPLAAIEAIEGAHFLANWSAALMERPAPFVADTRLGLLRARVTFSHQILFGIFVAALFSILWYEARTAAQRTVRTAVVGAGVFFSLSSAAFLLMAMQVGLIAAERATRPIVGRLVLVGAATAAAAVAVELAVNGGLVGFVTRYLSFSTDTAYYRQLIWLHVWDDILANPLFGTGGAWSRPHWMVESVDHVYFAKALRYGVPTILLVAAAGWLIGRRLLRAGAWPGDGVWRSLRLGWFFCVIGIAAAGLTVDYFGRALPFVMFVIGLGSALDRMAGASGTAPGRR